MRENRALVISSPGHIALERRPIPEPGRDEALIEVQYVALCGSDSKLFAGAYTNPHRYPVVLGHEWVGRAVSVGEGAGDLKPGDFVVGDCSVYCGECAMCAVNRNHCEAIEKRGITIDGGCADYIAVNRRHLYRCPPAEDCKPFVLTEPTSVGANGIGRVPREALGRASRALVFGAGGIGLLTLLTLQEFPFDEIVMTDPAREKLELALGFGFPNVRACDDAAGLDPASFGLVVEAAGSAASLKLCSRLAAPAAHVVLLGHQKPCELDFGEIMGKSLTIHASNGSTGGFERALAIVQKRKGIIERLITATVPLDEAADYISRRRHAEGNIKVVIDLRSGR
ncbi:MAG: alcohol dehydrogenase catalytic domain-containing protein [Clostridiales Family XIII bacterium]|jgi:threonine dehydrogenase-like Zn-dependent dehydrogenase|nr:alcohol dehydrogenase catalytic domain-containing protein [Clostridiales Family XIII bacterium]